MRALNFLVFPALLGISLMAQGQVYQSTDEQGNVTFSDQPTPDSEEIVVPATNVGDSVDVPPPTPELEPEPEVVADDVPAAPQGELYVNERDDNSRNRRRPRAVHHGGGGHGR